MTTSTLSQNGQTTIPAKVREFLHVGPSDKLLYRFDGERVFIESASTPTEALYGSLKSSQEPPEKQDLREARKAYYSRKQGK